MSRWPACCGCGRRRPPTRQAVRLATLAGGGHAVASHRAAAALHHLDGFASGLIEVSVPRPRRLELPRVVVHHVQAPPPEDLTVIGGIPVTGLARTLCDLGTVVDARAVERALDDARRRGTSLRWLRETAERLHRPGQAGTKTLLLLLDTVEHDRGVRGSWFEKLVEECLRSPDLPPLVRQHRVHDATGALAGILDLAFPTIRLGVEAHSRQFHFGRDAEQRDEDRDHRLARCGWEVLYVGWQLAKRPRTSSRSSRHRPPPRSPPPDRRSVSGDRAFARACRALRVMSGRGETSCAPGGPMAHRAATGGDGRSVS